MLISAGNAFDRKLLLLITEKLYTNMRKIVLTLLLAGLCAACVPPTRFKALKSQSLSCQEQRDVLKAENEKLEVENREMMVKLGLTEAMLARAGRDTVKWKEEVNRLGSQFNQLGKDYHDLQEAHQAMLKGSEGETGADGRTSGSAEGPATAGGDSKAFDRR
jgi:hypothetical protein